MPSIAPSPEIEPSITADEIACFERDGAVTIDSPLPREMLAAADACLDRELPRERADGGPEHGHRVQRTADCFEQPILDIMQHPFLERIAQCVLRAEKVVLRTCSIVKTFPEGGKPLTYWEHVDIKYTTADLDAAPRRMICTCLLWLTDVTIDRAPLMVRAGSHRQIARAMDRDFHPIDDPQTIDDLPKLPYAEPRPILATAGQVTICTTATVHGASVCTGPLPRKAIFLPFSARGCSIRANLASVRKRCAFNRELRSRYRPDRLHLIPDDAEIGGASSNAR
jgi:hypothetical protein